MMTGSVIFNSLSYNKKNKSIIIFQLVYNLIIDIIDKYLLKSYTDPIWYLSIK